MNKRIFTLLLSCVLVLSLVACGSSTVNTGTSENCGGNVEADTVSAEESSGTSTMATGEFQGYFFRYDASWRFQLNEAGTFLYLYPTDNNADGFVVIHYESASVGTKEANLLIFTENATSSEDITDVAYNYETDVLGVYARSLKYTQVISGANFSVDCYAIADGDVGVLSVLLCVPEDSTEDYLIGFLTVASTIGRFLDDYGDYPDKNIDDIDEEVSEGIDIFYIYLNYSDEWNTLSFAEQTDLAEACVEYCAQRAEKHYGISQTNIGIFAFTEGGQSAFTYDGGSEVRIFTNDQYDYSYNLIG